jgi:hypothetical protein
MKGFYADSHQCTDFPFCSIRISTLSHRDGAVERVEEVMRAVRASIGAKLIAILVGLSLRSHAP